MSQVTDDYFKTIRSNNTPQHPGNPDIGAHEYTTGGATPAPTPTPPPSLSLSPGWNEIVWPDVSDHTARTALENIDADCGLDTGLVIAQKKQDWWENYILGYGGEDFQLQADQDYFIKVNKECQWLL